MGRIENQMTPCIVSYLDLPGVQGLERGQAADLMHNFHQAAKNAIESLGQGGQRAAHQHMYCWNDSCFCWAPLSDVHDAKMIMAEVGEIQKAIGDSTPENRPYAISVRGKSFPGPHLDAFSWNVGRTNQPQFVYLKVSSYALKNCLVIEELLGRYRKRFYVDERIVTAAGWQSAADAVDKVRMAPSGASRQVHMYSSLPL